MFATYLRRELRHRMRQTVIVAIGMALAIALVIVVSALSAGVRDAQSQVLESIYGVGTDITVTGPAAAPGGAAGPQFQFDSGAGTTDEDAGTTSISQTSLTTDRGTSTFDAATLETITGVDGVAAATATLSLQNTTFNGKVPDPSQFMPQGGPMGQSPAEAPSSGGADGAGGSAFDIATFSVEGIDVASSSVGPLTAVEVTDGRALEASDAGSQVAVVDSTYATSADLEVGDLLAIGGAEFEIVGVVASTSSDATTLANLYIPLDVAQSLAGLDGLVSTVYVQAADASQVATIAAALEEAVPDAVVSTQEDLASNVSGSLSTAAGLVGNLGTWLSVIVLGAAFVLAILFTISGVGRRTREFGTLKAIGWSDGRIVRQVAGESLVQGLIGGVVGIALGLAGIWAVNLVAPTLSATTGSGFTFGGGGAPVIGSDAGTGEAPAGGPAMTGGPMGGPGTTTTTDIVLDAPVAVQVLVLAVALAVLGGLLAGAIGGWRAARLRPAEALRSVA